MAKCSHVDNNECAIFELEARDGWYVVRAKNLHGVGSGSLDYVSGNKFTYNHTNDPIDYKTVESEPRHRPTLPYKVTIEHGDGVTTITMDQPEGIRTPDVCNSLLMDLARSTQKSPSVLALLAADADADTHLSACSSDGVCVVETRIEMFGKLVLSGYDDVSGVVYVRYEQSEERTGALTFDHPTSPPYTVSIVHALQTIQILIDEP